MSLREAPQTPLPDHFEIVRGDVVELMPTGGTHGVVESNVGYLLKGLQLRGLGLALVGDVGIVVERQPLTCRGADAAFALQSQLPCQTSSEGYLLTPPALVVEVVSPNDRASQIEEKVGEYLQAGVLSVWVVYPTSRHLVVHLTDGTSRKLRSTDKLWVPGLPEFSELVSALFAGLNALKPASGQPTV